MPTTLPENCCSRMISSMWRLRMNRTPFSRALNSSPRDSAAPFVRAPLLATLAAVVHQPRREVTRAHARDPGVLLRDRSLLDVGRRAFHEEGHRPPGARHAAIAVRAGNASHAHVVRHQEFPGGVAVVGIRPMEVALVVAVRRLGRGVHDRPVGVVPEEEVRILGQFLHGVQPRSGDEPFRSPSPAMSRCWSGSPPPSETWPPLCSILPPTSKF